jgi:hypothetical protein
MIRLFILLICISENLKYLVSIEFQWNSFHFHVEIQRILLAVLKT